MSYLPSFAIWQFALAGAIVAAGPIIIHLLNRRRYRVVQWAAMDFLREALQRSRRIMQIRDLIILAIRTLAVGFVGLALAQPFFSDRDEEFDGTQPLHAVLVIDNSLSMGYYESGGDTLLDQARERAKRFIDRLPADSRVSVIPLCGSQAGYSPDALTKEDAQSALEQDKIEAVDRSASIQRALNEARKACAAGPMLAKRIVVFSDQQLANWKDLTDAGQFADLPPVQFVEIAAGQRENTWISGLRIEDGVADVDTPTTFRVEVRHEGAAPRRDVQVTLSVDDVEVASKTVTLDPGLGAREVAFQYIFSAYRPEPGKPIAVPVKASITPDKLPADDERHLVVHVVAALPVVFVDQYGARGEDPVKNRLGETRPLRKLLAPVTSRRESQRQLVRVRHIRLDQLERDTLEDARLVVIAGLADPGEKVQLLREYVEQGGQLMIAAGGESDAANNAGFDPQRWTETAWLEGGGILPAPLVTEPVGATPTAAGAQLKWFYLSYPSLGSHEYFQLADMGEDALRDLYAEPLFFKAVQADLTDDTLKALDRAEVKRIEERLRLQADTTAKQRAVSKQAGALSAGEQSQLREEESKLRQMQPTWLLWSPLTAATEDDDLPQDEEQRQKRLEDLAARTRPRVLARFDNAAGTPFLIERKIGRGTVLFASTGLLSDWNTLPQTNTFLIFDRILRSMILTTLPQRNFPATERLTLPLPTGQPEISVVLRRPGEDRPVETLDTGFIGRDQRGFTVPRPLARGLYKVSATTPSTGDGGAAPETLWDLPLTINGDAAESELAPLTRDQFEQRVAAANVHWVGPAEEISLAGSQIRGQDSWWWLVLAIVCLLFVELLLLGAPAWKARPQPEMA